MPLIGFISTLDPVEERISELVDISVEITKTESKGTKENKQINNKAKNYGHYQKCNICVMGISEKE